jgi:hypothetical protein
VVSGQLLGKVVEGSGYCLIQDTVVAFTWKN